MWLRRTAKVELLPLLFTAALGQRRGRGPANGARLRHAPRLRLAPRASKPVENMTTSGTDPDPFT